MNRKVKVLIISLSILFLILAIGSISYQLWNAYQVGNLAINSSQTDVAYSVSGDENVFAGNQTLFFLKTGDYTIKAYGLMPGIYTAKTIKVRVLGNRTTTVDLNLDIDPKGYNHGGVEGP